MSGDAAATASNIAAHELLVRVGTAIWPIVAVVDVVAALTLYVVFKQVNKSVSLLAGWFRLVCTAVFAAGVFSFLSALQILGGSDFVKVFPTDQLNALLFGTHLGILGYVA